MELMDKINKFNKTILQSKAITDIIRHPIIPNEIFLKSIPKLTNLSTHLFPSIKMYGTLKLITRNKTIPSTIKWICNI